MKNIFKNRFFVGSVCVLLAAIITFFVIPTTLNSSQNENPVYVAATPIEKGDIISEEHLTTIRIPTKYLPAKTITEKEDIIGKYAVSDLAENDYFYTDKLSTQQVVEDNFFKQLDENNLAISVTLKTMASGLSAKLEPDDIVSIIAVNGMQTAIPNELKYVKVLSITTETASNYDAQNKTNTEMPSTVTLLTTSKQAEILVDLELNYNLHFALVTRANEEKANELLKIQKQILNEQVEVNINE